MFESILTTTVAGGVTPVSYILCSLVSLALGILVACVYMYRTECSKNFVVTLALLPVIVQLVIMMVNGNLGTGVAVAGAFSLIRFRSVPGTSREIGAIFLAMAIGLATGMGYIGYAALAAVFIGAAMLLLGATRFGERKTVKKELRVTIPEDLDYTGAFDDLFQKYTRGAELRRVKTTNMGSMYELRYAVTLRDESQEKAFLDELRCRNGNLTVSCGRYDTGAEL